MKISELISLLETQKNKHGDLIVKKIYTEDLNVSDIFPSNFSYTVDAEDKEDSYLSLWV